MIKQPNLWKKEQDFYIKVLQNDWYKLLIKLQNLLSVETTKFYEKKGILTIHLPITTGSISSPMGLGSDSIPVKVNLFGNEVYLADSMQFLLEYGCRLTDKGVYYIMPTFRGEQADSRHLCQFYHSEAEIHGDLDDIITLVEDYIKYLSKQIVVKLGKELQDIIGDISHIKKMATYNGHFPKITFNEAEQLLEKHYGNEIHKYIEYNNGWRNITSAGEQAIMKIYDGIVWITNYDILTVPFYQQFDKENKATTKNADLLFGIGETVGCGERHCDYNELLESLKVHGVKSEDYDWYVNMKKLFPLKTSGFGMGTERFLMWVMKCDDIRNMQICLRFNDKKIIM